MACAFRFFRFWAPPQIISLLLAARAAPGVPLLCLLEVGIPLHPLVRVAGSKRKISFSKSGFHKY
jgi:hypothetical protein